MNILLKSLFLLMSLLVMNVSSFAYPQFIGYGYTSCLTCHYNPHGNGPLTDYGRALGTTAISSDILYSDKMTDEKLTDWSKFPFLGDISERIRPSLDYRGLYIKRNIDKDLSPSDWINMDANFNLVLRLGPESNRDKLIISASMGYAPVPRSLQSSDIEEYRSREHYIGYRVTKSIGVYAGLMDKVYGVRIPDHIAFSRTTTGNTQNDQTHGVLFHYVKPEFEIGIQHFVGNLQEDESVRQKGFAANFEYTLNDKNRPGMSLQFSESEFLKNTAVAAHTRLGFGKGNSLVGEVGINKKEFLKRGTDLTSQYWLVQSHLLIKKGFFFLNTIEYLRADSESDVKVLRWGPGFQFFITRGLEFRMDLYNTRNFSPNVVSDDTWDLTGQLHVWL